MVYIMSHVDSPKRNLVWEIIRAHNWGLVDQFPAPEYEKLWAAAGFALDLDPTAVVQNIVCEIIGTEQGPIDDLKESLNRSLTASLAPSSDFDFSEFAAAEEQIGLLLGYPAASAHWFGYHYEVEGGGDISSWSDDELLFGQEVHPKDSTDLEAARRWAQSQADAFIEAYGREMLANFPVDRPDPEKPDEGLSEGFGQPEDYIPSSACPRCHPV